MNMGVCINERILRAAVIVGILWFVWTLVSGIYEVRDVLEEKEKVVACVD